MKKFALAVLFSLAGLAGFGELAGLPGVVKHKFIEPGTYVSTDTWMTVSGRVDGVATKRANDAAKKYASTSCARILPPYLHEVSFDDVYPDDAAWFYQQVGHAYTGHCSARRNGNVLERNFDWKFNEAPTFVIRISAAAGRFASLGVATIGDLVTEGQVNSHQWFPYFRCLPGHTVDGVNERGVVCEVNVTDGTWPRTEGEIHGLGAVRWALDYGTNAQQVAEYLAEHVYLPEGFGGNLHWIVADATSTYIVEDGEAIPMTEQPVVMTNFSQDRTGGEGYERWASLTNLATTIESQWWTKAYDRNTRPIRLTDLGPDYEQIWTYWAQYPKELHRNQKIGGIGWWQTVHCSKYDISGKALVIAVQEQDQWYRFALQTGGGGGGGAVDSVNGKTGAVVLDATDVHALPDTYTPPAADLTPAIEYTTDVSNRFEKSKLQRNALNKISSDFALEFENMPGSYLIRKIPYTDDWWFGGQADMAASAYSLYFNDDSIIRYDYEAGVWVVFNEFGQDGELATMPSVNAAIATHIDATDPTFSNAVLAVGLNIDTNSVAVLNEIAATFGDFPITGTATTVGGLLAALAAAVAWLRKNKIDKLKVTGMTAEATAENGVAKLDDFFKESNTLLNARITYERNETGLKDRAFNALTFDGTEYNLSTALTAVTPTASGQPRDLLIVATATAATTISFTAGTIKGDKPTIDGAGTWLITLTEYASGVWYCRQIKMEDAA